LGDNADVEGTPIVKRYALVANDGDDGLRRFHLARVASSSRSARRPDRLERMEDVAARERQNAEGRGGPSSPPFYAASE
jgi:hypothetical protein